MEDEKELITITYSEVKKFIKNNKFHLNPNQRAVSYPIIERIHRRYQQGHRFSDIKVDRDTIIDGHHRFISLSLLGVKPEETDGGENTTKKQPIKWSSVTIDKNDWDSWIMFRSYEKRYDEGENE